MGTVSDSPYACPTCEKEQERDGGSLSKRIKRWKLTGEIEPRGDWSSHSGMQKSMSDGHTVHLTRTAIILGGQLLHVCSYMAPVGGGAAGLSLFLLTM